MSWYNFTSTISKPPGIFLEWADVISVSEEFPPTLSDGTQGGGGGLRMLQSGGFLC